MQVVLGTSKAASIPLMPEAVTNIYQGVVSLSRIFRLTCEGGERMVVGVDGIATEMLRQKNAELKSRLLAAE